MRLARLGWVPGPVSARHPPEEQHSWAAWAPGWASGRGLQAEAGPAAAWLGLGFRGLQARADSLAVAEDWLEAGPSRLGFGSKLNWLWLWLGYIRYWLGLILGCIGVL